jgi:hypothetical protein
MLYLNVDEFEQFCKLKNIRYSFKSDGFCNSLKLFVMDKSFYSSNFGHNTEECKKKLFVIMTNAINNLDIGGELFAESRKFDVLKIYRLNLSAPI